MVGLASRPDVETRHADTPYGLGKELRLQSAAEFTRVLRAGTRSSDKLFTVAALPNAFAHSRLGMTVSRKTAPLAVARNRIRRQIRESFRLAVHTIAPLDIVVMARPASAGADNASLRRSLAGHWRRLTRRCAAS